MSLTNMVIMPKTDYQDTCNAIRNITGGTGVIKSGDISTKLNTLNTELNTIASEQDTIIANIINAVNAKINVLPIKFTLAKTDGTALSTLKAKRGMTFAEWIGSEYCTAAAWISGTTVYVGSYKSSDFTSNTVITDGTTYHMVLNS